MLELVPSLPSALTGIQETQRLWNTHKATAGRIQCDLRSLFLLSLKGLVSQIHIRIMISQGNEWQLGLEKAPKYLIYIWHKFHKKSVMDKPRLCL